MFLGVFYVVFDSHNSSNARRAPGEAEASGAPATAQQGDSPNRPDDGNRQPLPSTAAIEVRGARVHNLRNVDVDIPRDAFTVITGVSGSGKSSLAFDTLFAEGQRQYFETLSAYARQFLDQLQRPDVDSIRGLEPTLCVDQRAGASNPRSTVATVTEVYDFLRLLMARCGTAHCHQCGKPILQQPADQIETRLASLPEGTKLMVMAPLVRGRRGQHADVFQQIRRAGLVRARIDGEVYPLEALPELAPRKNHTIEAVVDRLVIRDGTSKRLSESIRLALRLGDESLLAVIQPPGSAHWEELTLSTRYACANCGISYGELEPRTFSFNSPYGACPRCDGLGVEEGFDPTAIAPNLSLSPAAGGLQPFSTPATKRRLRPLIEPVLEQGGGGWDQPLSDLRPAALTRLMQGGKGFGGIVALLDEEWNSTRSDRRRDQLEQFRAAVVCSACGGSRLRPESLAVRLADQSIHDITSLAVTHARSFFAELHLPPPHDVIAEPIVREIRRRLEFLERVGVGYLDLQRAADTLSGGELQRVRLAGHIGSGLVGVCYVLDEPSIGLHQRDNDQLIRALRQLQQQGNTVIVVEHDETIMRQADWLIDMGPGAGTEGGHVVAAGTPQYVIEHPHSLTARYLAGQMRIAAPTRRPVAERGSISIRGVTTHNLKSVDAQIPLRCLTCVTGVSGSGKSSLVVDTLIPAIARNLGQRSAKPGPYAELTGAEQVDKLVEIDQAPIGRSPRSCPATFTGAMDEIRKVMAETREARGRGFGAARFSFNSPQGRCPTCKGQGVEKIEMNFLNDLVIPCSTCGGRRYEKQTLAIHFKGASVADILEMTVDQAVDFFANFPRLDRILRSLQAVGLGYICLGQSSTTLSGGEAQRLKLATELGRPETGSTLYLLDEPTTGLHHHDVRRLLDVLQQLVDRGNTVIVIEHNLEVAKSADWIIDLGPAGGDAGGLVLGAGTPEHIASLQDNATGHYLRELLET